ncbi:MAG: hypothetical protein L6Q31_09695 [Fimbriimonadaceae bacterium]|nr:hypothetical protein [Fimbriimonadaceae bacterium]
MRGSSDNPCAIAIDMGATSVRFALGELVGDSIRFEIVEQTPHEPLQQGSHTVWNVDALLGACRRAEELAIAKGATLGIDAWGVDHGFVDPGGDLLQPPVCYRDPSHVEAFDRLAHLRHEMYLRTGIQHQPFNTVYQLAARYSEQPELNSPSVRWLILPELMAHLLGAPAGHELTQASTTQLLGLDGSWCADCFRWIDAEPPASGPQPPGNVVGKSARGTEIVRVAGHDTASAVMGLGSLGQRQAFLNVGTWSILGLLLDAPLADTKSEDANFTNERAADGRVRFLANIPGFYVINRLHQELGIREDVPSWLATAAPDSGESLDLFDPTLFSPQSMIEAARMQGFQMANSEEWASLALHSLVRTLAGHLDKLTSVTGREIDEVRIAGGGSASTQLCQALADATRRPVIAGPQEATVLGNLGVQFLAQGHVADFAELARLLDRSIPFKTFRPS